MHINFHNVTLTVLADDEAEAYAKLCAVLDTAARAGWLEYTTDSFSVEGQDVERTTDREEVDRRYADLSVEAK